MIIAVCIYNGHIEYFYNTLIILQILNNTSNIYQQTGAINTGNMFVVGQYDGTVIETI